MNTPVSKPHSDLLKSLSEFSKEHRAARWSGTFAAFLEGIFVRPGARRQGVGQALVATVEQWGREQGCTELGSDARLDNPDSHAFHGGCGFDETGRVVYFRKPL